MIHPLLRLAATEPHLIGDHVEAYAALVGEEVGKISTSVITRVVLYVAALCMVAVGLVLIGVALLFVAAISPSDYPAPWAMVVVPLAPFVIADRLHRLRALEADRKGVRHDQEAAQRRHGDAARGERVDMSTVASPSAGTTRIDASSPAAAHGQAAHRRRWSQPWRASAPSAAEVARVGPTEEPSHRREEAGKDERKDVSRARPARGFAQPAARRDDGHRAPAAAPVAAVGRPRRAR